MYATFYFLIQAFKIQSVIYTYSTFQFWIATFQNLKSHWIGQHKSKYFLKIIISLIFY